jgi:hypothetical protein
MEASGARAPFICIMSTCIIVARGLLVRFGARSAVIFLLRLERFAIGRPRAQHACRGRGGPA